MTRGALSIADLLRCLAALRPGDPEALETLCALLQFDRPRELPALKPDPTPPPSAAPGAPLRRPSGQEGLTPSSGPIRSELRSLASRGEKGSPWSNAQPLPVSVAVTARPRIEPLLSPQVRTALLSTTVATREAVGAWDVEHAIETIASGRAVTRLERRAVPSLRRGVHLLADVGEGMIPYAADRGELIAAIQKVAGKELTVLAMFAGTPLRKAGRGPRHTWRHWTPPPRGTPVLLLSELGIGGPLVCHDRAPLGEWIRFCEDVQRQGCPLLALVPYAPDRWPSALSRRMTLLTWDRDTTVAAIQHAVRKGIP